jgi:hypothetical protein
MRLMRGPGARSGLKEVQVSQTYGRESKSDREITGDDFSIPEKCLASKGR